VKEQKKTMRTELTSRIAIYYRELITETLGIEYRAKGYFLSLSVMIAFSIFFVASFILAMAKTYKFFLIPLMLFCGVFVYAAKAKKKYGQKTKGE
jgi:predicted neutral ceramidase superfamily lipid hydrolase